MTVMVRKTALELEAERIQRDSLGWPVYFTHRKRDGEEETHLACLLCAQSLWQVRQSMALEIGQLLTHVGLHIRQCHEDER